MLDLEEIRSGIKPFISIGGKCKGEAVMIVQVHVRFAPVPLAHLGESRQLMNLRRKNTLFTLVHSVLFHLLILFKQISVFGYPGTDIYNFSRYFLPIII